MGLLKTAFSVATGGIGGAALGVGSWLLKHWKLVLAVVVVLAVGIAFKVVLVQRDHARAQVAEDAVTIQTLTTQRDALQINVKTLAAEIAKQGASIDALRSDAETAQAASRQAMQTAATQQQKDAAAIAALRKRGADPSNKGSCDAEISRIRAGL